MATEISKQFGRYQMTLRPGTTEKIINGQKQNIVTYAQVSLYDLSANWPLEWSKTMPIVEAQAALALFEGIGYFKIAMEA